MCLAGWLFAELDLLVPSVIVTSMAFVVKPRQAIQAPAATAAAQNRLPWTLFWKKEYRSCRSSSSTERLQNDWTVGRKGETIIQLRIPTIYIYLVLSERRKKEKGE